MRSPESYCRLGVLALILAVSFGGCRSEAGHGAGVKDVIGEATEPLESSEAAGMIPVDLPDTVLSEVRGPGGYFMVTARKGEMERFRCSGCHKGKAVQISGAAGMAHGDIALRHGEEGGRIDCPSCHHPEERDFLAGEGEKKIDFDHSYQLCGTCHFRQKKDWVGGAHGKRVTYWAGSRVVRNCTSCHDPHSPRFAVRWPSTFSLPLEDME
jgi:hypothetical protein